MNWVAVIAATVASIVLGFLWFSPVLFLKPWMAMRPRKSVVHDRNSTGLTPRTTSWAKG